MTILKPAMRSWSARIGIVTVIASTALIATANPSSAAAATTTATPSVGAAGTYISLATTTAGTFSALTPPGLDSVQFSSTACSATATAVPSNRTDATIVMTTASKNISGTGFAATDVGKLVTGTGIPAGTTIATYTSATAVVLSTAATATTTSGSPGTAIIGALYADDLHYLSPLRLIVQAPSALAAAANGTVYYICVWNTPAGTTTGVSLLSSTTATGFTAFTAPTITTVAPVSGPSIGGTPVTITGTGFSTTAASNKVTIGGAAATVTSATATTIIATAPAGTSSTGAIIVNSPSGTVTATPTFAYQDGLTVTPNTTTSLAKVNLDVLGSGFKSLTFNDAVSTAGANYTADADAHIFLAVKKFLPSLMTAGSYATSAAGLGGAAAAECTDVVVLTDTELICTLDPTLTSAPAGALADGTYQVVLASNNLGGATSFTRTTIVTSGSAFTIAPY